MSSTSSVRGTNSGADPFSLPPPFFRVPFFLHRPQTPQPGFGSITLLQKFTPYFKILDPRLNIPHTLTVLAT